MPYLMINTRADLGATDHVDCATIGPNNTPILSPHRGQTADGAWYFLMQPRHLVRKRQGRDAAATWVGNFTKNDAVLATALDPNPIEIRFASGVSAAGAQLQPGGLPLGGQIDFRASIVARDAAGVQLAVFDRNDGVSTNDDNGRAIFLGVLSDQANIVSVEFRVEWLDDAGQAVDFAINRLDIRGQILSRAVTV
jgi:hypothetical protein